MPGVRLKPEQRRLFDAAMAFSAVTREFSDEEILENFDEVMDYIGTYLVAEGIGDDDEINALGLRIEDLEDVVLRWKFARDDNQEAE